VGTGNGKFAITADADWRAENSPLALTLDARASQLEAFRFFGYGNDTPNIGRELSLVEQKVMSVEPAIVWRVGWRAREAGTDLIGLDTTTSRLRSTEGKVRFGPVLSWTDPDPVAGSPLLSSATGGDQFTYAGLRARMELDKTDDDAVPTMGWRLRTDLAAYPALMDLDDAFATAAVRASTYVPLGFAGSSMAFRVGGGISSGGMSNLVAAQFAPSIGGSSSLRGYRSRRFTGDAASNAAAEVRLPLGQVNFLVRSDVGVFALGDVGRVWYDGRSDGAWHTGVGGGIWAAALGGAVSFTYAHGEQHRFYLKAGLPF
jgi:outer membrane protein assembly factor BamA